MSTRLRSVCTVAMRSPLASLVTGGERAALLSPGGLLVERGASEIAQRTHRAPIHQHRRRRHARAGRLIHERHELVGKPGHGAADANAADIRTAADAVDPTATRHVAVDHRAPAAELDDALARTV